MLPEDFKRAARLVREDVERLNDDDMFEEMLFSMAVVLTVFAAMWGVIELGYWYHS